MTAFLYALSALLGVSVPFNLFQGDYGDTLWNLALAGLTAYVAHRQSEGRHSPDAPQDFQYRGKS